MGKIIFENIEDFHPDHVFDCGQCFRWEKEQDGSYTGIVGGRVVNAVFLPHEGQSYSGTLILDNAAEKDRDFWKCYFDLDRNYGHIKKALTEKDKVIEQALSCGQGIRILRQDRWETIVSFIVSQNNNIPRIKKGIESICRNFGEEIGTYRERTFYAMPGPEVLSELSEEDLSPCKLGYRAKYIVETAKQVVRDGAEKLDEAADPGRLSVEDAFAYVNSFCGVGPKVANCILLFSMNRLDSFPVDVWMTRVMEQLYGLKEKGEILTFAKEHFGEYGGIAQQYLFYYVRQGDKG